MILDYEKNIEIIDVLQLSSPENFKLVEFHCDLDNNQEENLKNNVFFSIYDIIHFAIVKTNDKKIRNCICYLNEYHFLQWKDTEEIVISKNYIMIINYENYLKQMKHLKTIPLSLIDYICQRTIPDRINLATEIILDCSIADLLKLGETKTNFKLKNVTNGYYDF